MGYIMTPMGAEMQILEARGIRSTAWVAGDGPVVLCLHGFPDHAASFRYQLPALAEAGYRAVAPTCAWTKDAAFSPA